MSPTIPEVLRAAADHMDRVGKHEGSLFADWRDTSEAPCCAMGALDRAVEQLATSQYRPDVFEADEALRRWLTTQTEELSLTQWSDASSKDTVVAGLRAAADMYEGRQ